MELSPTNSCNTQQYSKQGWTFSNSERIKSNLGQITKDSFQRSFPKRIGSVPFCDLNTRHISSQFQRKFRYAAMHFAFHISLPPSAVHLETKNKFMVKNSTKQFQSAEEIDNHCSTEPSTVNQHKPTTLVWLNKCIYVCCMYINCKLKQIEHLPNAAIQHLQHVSTDWYQLKASIFCRFAYFVSGWCCIPSSARQCIYCTVRFQTAGIVQQLILIQSNLIESSTSITIKNIESIRWCACV